MTDQLAEQAFLDRCTTYVATIRTLEQQKAEMSDDPKWRNARDNELREIKHLLGELLGDRCLRLESPRQLVTPCWTISGQPPKELKGQARQWLAERGMADATTSELRLAVEEALEDGEHLPAGHFGLQVRRTVRFTDLN